MQLSHLISYYLGYFSIALTRTKQILLCLAYLGSNFSNFYNQLDLRILLSRRLKTADDFKQRF